MTFISFSNGRQRICLCCLWYVSFILSYFSISLTEIIEITDIIKYIMRWAIMVCLYYQYLLYSCKFVLILVWIQENHKTFSKKVFLQRTTTRLTSKLTEWNFANIMLQFLYLSFVLFSLILDTFSIYDSMACRNHMSITCKHCYLYIS